MIWLELRKNNTERNPGWSYLESVWAPEKKANGSSWAFWKLVGQVTKGDLIFHLHHNNGAILFEGYSIAADDGYVTQGIPTTDAHAWSFAKRYYKVDLKDYEELNPKIEIKDFFKNNDVFLRDYFLKNKIAKKTKKHLFYVIQKNKLQCLNGAYFSEFGTDLADLLSITLDEESRKLKVNQSTYTDECVKELKQRIGQQEFSDNVKLNFNYKYCFPNCNITGKGFLVGGHIDRWADNKTARGETSNGLCLCLVHDKAFEKGFFTISEVYKVVIKDNVKGYDWLFKNLVEAKDLKIKNCEIDPNLNALKSHWMRTGFTSLIKV